MRLLSMGLAFASLLTISTTAWADTFFDTVEQPGVQSTTMTLLNVGVATFDTLATGPQTFTTDFGTGGTIVGTFANVDVQAANLYGGANGVGNFASDYAGSFSLTFATPQTYVGMWISALNATNNLAFYSDGTLVYTFAPAQLLSFVANNPAYYGNPNANFHNQDRSEPFAFVNFTDLTGRFNQIVVSGYGYELDNIDVGTVVSTTSAAEVFNLPEPAPVGVLGVALIGLGFVRRLRQHPA